ncbi:MAG: FlgD immunoglobulin-like domain containing protein, partial [candidate division Zixibacteria bacterium]
AALIQDAVDVANPGDTIYVGEGTWTEFVILSSDRIALIGMGAGNTIIENYTSSFTIRILGDTVTIEGFSLISDYNLIANSGISCLYFGHVEIKNNYFFGNHAGVSGNLGGRVTNNYFESNNGAFLIVSVKDSLTLSNNTVFHDEGPTFFIDDMYPDGSKFIIRNNLLYAHSQSSTFVYYVPPSTDTVFIHNNVFFKKIGISGGPGVTLTFGLSTDLHKFYNNTINGVYDSCSIYVRSAGIKAYYHDTVATIDNNIVMNCDYILRNDSDIPAKVRYSVFYNIAEDYFHGPGEFGEGNIFENPMFMDTLDFHLQAFSRAVDSGDPAVFDPDGSRSDIGAYGGPYGETYEYFDLPPEIPDSLWAEVSSEMDTIYIHWRFNTESDFNLYQVHRDTIPDFEPDIFNLIAEPESSYHADIDWTPDQDYYYKIASIDNQDNRSEYSEELAVVFTGIYDYSDPNYPTSAVLHQNYPNPFNQNTVINYYLPNVGVQPGEVKLEIYDIMGRVIRTLVNERQYPGEYSLTWDGKDEMRRELPSGVYFYRLFITGIEFSKPKKLMLMK